MHSLSHVTPSFPRTNRSRVLDSVHTLSEVVSDLPLTSFISKTLNSTLHSSPCNRAIHMFILEDRLSDAEFNVMGRREAPQILALD